MVSVSIDGHPVLNEINLKGIDFPGSIAYWVGGDATDGYFSKLTIREF